MKRYLIAFLIMGIASALDVDHILARVKAKYDSISTMQGRFSQITSVKGVGESARFEGRFYLKRPDLLRLEILTPESQLFVYDGKNLWTYIKGINTVYKTEFTNQTPFFSPFTILKDYKERYRVDSLPEEEGGLVWIKLIPKTPEPLPIPISLGIDLRTYYIKGLGAVDPAGNRQSFKLSNVIYNKKLSPKLFSFTPPEGAEVIEESPHIPSED